MTDVEQVKIAVDLGVDAIGMILHANSPRTIEVEQAIAIRAVVPAFVSLVGVFVDCPERRVNDMCTKVGLDLIQLHGNESDEFGCRLNRPFIKAVRAKTAQQVQRDVIAFPHARAILVDPYQAGRHGGTGQQLDPLLWPEEASQNLILAGGLSADNIGSAIQTLQPFAVDFNSGLEHAPGQKDAELMAQAIKAVGLS